MGDRKKLPDKPDPAPAAEKSSREEEESASADQVGDAVRKLVEKKPEKLMEFMAMEMSSVGNPLHQKMTTEHISQVIELASKHDEREYNLHKTAQEQEFSEGNSNRKYCFAAFVIIMVLTVLVLILFRNSPDVLIPILTGLGGLISGFLGGWGLGKQRS
jgi:hypothetical protein